MDHIPSKSISKSILLVTPLFLLVLGVLHSSSQLSYLFILRFINNVAGTADLTFIPTIQPQINHQKFQRDDLLNQYQMYPSKQIQNINIPLIDIKNLQKWVNKSNIIRGISPRWIIPAKIGKTDIILLVLNISQQKNIGIINQNSISNLDGKQMAMQQQLANKLAYSVGDVATINIQPKNFLNGLKLFQKFSDLSSDQQYKPQNPQISIDQISKSATDFLKTYTQRDIKQEDVKSIINLLYNNSVDYQLTLKRSFYPQGIYPSVLSNVVIVEYEGFQNIISQWAINALLKVNQNENENIKDLLPPEYQKFWPKNTFQAQFATSQVKNSLGDIFSKYSLMSVCSLNNRQKVYYPQKQEQYNQFTLMLQSTPGNMQIIIIYPFFQQSLAIKYFFDSVIQIFQFVTCIIYFYTMTLIMKQIYQQKQVEVGIWRTLGAGGVSQRKKDIYQIQMSQNKVQSKGSNIKYRSQFQSNTSLLEKIKFIGQLAYKVGFINYWVITTAISLILYFLLKLILYSIICSKLGYSPIMQPLENIPIIYVIVFTFVQVLVYQHIHRIFTSPLSQTIKPVKRTFDVVKVRVIHVATFGVSLQILLISVMLIYYGVVSYYWIPYSVLIGNSNLQVFLFNTIFLFMIFGSIILLSILQSRIEVGIFSIIFRFSSQMRTMKLAILKNIKAKKYKNIKVSIIISIIFAFVLFFTAGIKIQMQIIQSFIQRALGSNLVFQNYQKNTFNNTLVNQILDNQSGVQYAWLSKGLSRDNVTISLLSHISNKYISPQIQVLSSTYLNSTFYQYYYPEDYLPEQNSYWKLPNSIKDGFNSIYTGQGGKQSVGKYNPSDTIKQADPNNINVQGIYSTVEDMVLVKKTIMAPNEQIINLVVSSALRKQLGVEVGSLYKMVIANKIDKTQFVTRAKITHSFKAGPGFDILGRKAFISQQQAAYIYRALGIDEQISKQNQKLFIKGTKQSLKGIGSSIIPISPQHTQMFQIQFVSQSFALLSKYLNAYVVLITAIMSTLVTIFIFLYTLGKCRQEAEMFKMLRAIGLSAKSIRIMVFSQIIIRLIVSILNGILLGVLFSIGFSLQIEQFLMIKTPPMDITIVCLIGLVLTLLFSLTIIRATRYISQKSVAQTNKI